MKPRPPLIVQTPTLLSRMETARNVAIEIRAAELVAISLHTKGAKRFNKMSALELDWLVHGDWPPHSPTQRCPETDEEHAALLAHWIEWHDHEQWLAERLREPACVSG